MKPSTRLTPWLLRESANLICGFRLLGSLILLATNLLTQLYLPIFAVFYSLFLLSDLFDGFCFRKYVAADPPRHWFNRFPVTLDPLSDLIFTLTGAIFVLHAYKVPPHFVLLALIGIALLALLLAVLIQIRPRGFIHHLAVAALTYGCYLIMLANTLFIWKLCYPEHYIIAFSLTMVVFYATFFAIVPKDRYARW